MKQNLPDAVAICQPIAVDFLRELLPNTIRSVEQTPRAIYGDHSVMGARCIYGMGYEPTVWQPVDVAGQPFVPFRFLGDTPADASA